MFISKKRFEAEMQDLRDRLLRYGSNSCDMNLYNILLNHHIELLGKFYALLNHLNLEYRESTTSGYVKRGKKQ